MFFIVHSFCLGFHAVIPFLRNGWKKFKITFVPPKGNLFNDILLLPFSGCVQFFHFEKTMKKKLCSCVVLRLCVKRFVSFHFPIGLHRVRRAVAPLLDGASSRTRSQEASLERAMRFQSSNIDTCRKHSFDFMIAMLSLRSESSALF